MKGSAPPARSTVAAGGGGLSSRGPCMGGDNPADPLVTSLIVAVQDYGIITLDPAGRVLSWNVGAERLTGYRAAEIVGRSLEVLYPTEDVTHGRPRIHLSEAAAAGRLRYEGWRVRADGSRFWADVVLNALYDHHQQLQGFGEIVRDSTQNRMFQRELMRQALHDPLTGLPNRALLLDRLGKALTRLKRLGGTVAVFFVDLDRFKEINDSLGHQAGDQVLVTVADRLRSAVRTQDTVGRLSGDEFVVLCEGLHAELPATVIAQRLVAALAVPMPVSGQSIPVSASIGIAVTDSAEDEPETLLREADLAMYKAKRTVSRDRVHFELLHRE